MLVYPSPKKNEVITNFGNDNIFFLFGDLFFFWNLITMGMSRVYLQVLIGLLLCFGVLYILDITVEKGIKEYKVIRGSSTVEILDQLEEKELKKIEKYKKKLKDASHIEPYGIYIGSIWNAVDEEFIKTKNITTILHFATDFPGIQLVPHITSLHQNILRYSVSEHTSQFSIIQNCTSILHQAISENQNVLVHCMRGRSRSVSVVIAYLMEYHNYTYNDAREYIASKRPFIGPHEGLIAQLQRFELYLKENKEIINNE